MKLTPLVRAAAIGALLALPLAPARAVDNVANDRFPPSIVMNGIFGQIDPSSPWFGAPKSFAPPDTLVNSVFVGDGANWLQNTVFWDSRVPGAGSNSIVIRLGANYSITQLLIEADNNDLYPIDYWNGSGWTTAWTPDSYAFLLTGGMRTRVSGPLAAFTTDRLRVRGILGPDGDYAYAVSEVMAFGTYVSHAPEPTTWALMLAGLGAMAVLARRRSRALQPE